MNIFALNDCPIISANQALDAHSSKMPTETAQMLSTALHRAGQNAPMQKIRNESHPAVLWTERTEQNFNWVLEHGFALAAEYERRYAETHAALSALEKIAAQSWRPKKQGLEKFGQYIPEKYHSEDPCDGYRKVYFWEKIAFAYWSLPSEPPLWWWKKLFPALRLSVGEILTDGKIKFSPQFTSDLFLYLDKNVPKKKTERLSLNQLRVDLGFGPAVIIPERKKSAPRPLLKPEEQDYYQTQFLLHYLLTRNFFPGFAFVGGKNPGIHRVKF